jgi:Prion-inhibition and propagation
MDPTSFAVGVVGLAGLVSTCIEAFQILRDIRSFPRDTEILFTKLDIEKELFLQWARQVGLLKKHNSDRRGGRDRKGTRKGMRNLFDTRTDSLIRRVLGEIRILLEEASGMEGKYTSISNESSSAHGERRVGQHYHHTQHNDGSSSGKKPSLRRKFIWTVHGRDELKSLIDELGYFIGKLYELIPSLEQRRASVKELREAGADVTTLSMLMLAEGSQRSRDDDSERYGGVSPSARSRDDESDWSDLASEVASEVASRAESRIARKSSQHQHQHQHHQRHEYQRRKAQEDKRDVCSEDDDESRSKKEHSRSRGRRQDRGRGYERDFDYDQVRRRSGSHVSAHSHGSSHSHASSGCGSYGSSRSTLVEMFGDMVGRNGRPSSGFR